MPARASLISISARSSSPARRPTLPGSAAGSFSSLSSSSLTRRAVSVPMARWRYTSAQLSRAPQTRGDEQVAWDSSSAGRRFPSLGAARTRSSANSTLPASLRSRDRLSQAAAKTSIAAHRMRIALGASRARFIVSAGTCGRAAGAELGRKAALDFTEPAGRGFVEDVTGQDRGDHLSQHVPFLRLEKEIDQIAAIEGLNDTDVRLVCLAGLALVRFPSRGRDIALCQSFFDGRRRQIGPFDRQMKTRREERIDEARGIAYGEPAIAARPRNSVAEVGGRARGKNLLRPAHDLTHDRRCVEESGEDGVAIAAGLFQGRR